jgi:hypothetical protein
VPLAGVPDELRHCVPGPTRAANSA